MPTRWDRFLQISKFVRVLAYRDDAVVSKPLNIAVFFDPSVFSQIGFSWPVINIFPSLLNLKLCITSQSHIPECLLFLPSTLVILELMLLAVDSPLIEPVLHEIQRISSLKEISIYGGLKSSLGIAFVPPLLNREDLTSTPLSRLLHQSSVSYPTFPTSNNSSSAKKSDRFLTLRSRCFVTQLMADFALWRSWGW